MKTNMIMKSVLSVALTLTFLLSFAASATITRTNICDHCVTSSSFRVAAEQGAGGIPLVNVYVANTNTLDVRKFNLSKQRDKNTGQFGPYTISEESIGTELKTSVIHHLNERENLQRYLARPVEIPSTVAGSAWEMAGNSSIKNYVIDYYQQDQSTIQYIADYIGSGVSAFGGWFNLDAAILIPVTFADSSSAQFRLVGFDGQGTIQLQLLAAKDSLNNDIPLSASQINGQYAVSDNGTGGEQRIIVHDALVRLALSGGGSSCYTTIFSCDGRGKCYLVLTKCQ